MITNPTAAEFIKQATASAHAGTEKALIKYIKSIRQPQQYAALLGCMYGYFAPVEKMLDNYLPEVIDDYSQRRKAGRLLHDIQLLSQSKPASLATDLPLVTNTTEAIGCFYVLEGSILGGAVIKKIITAQTENIPPAAFSFFSGYQENTMDQWKAFISQLNNHVRFADQLRQASNAASSCFQKMEDWINRYYSRISPA